jgi:PAS domain S-box-containing protein
MSGHDDELRRRTEDLRDAKAALEARTAELAAALALLRAAFDSAPDGILVTDHAGRITGCNARYAEMWGVPHDMVESIDHERLLSSVAEQVEDPDAFVRHVREISTSAPTETHDLLTLADGRVLERTSRIQIVDGRNAGRVWNFRDVTERMRAEETRARLAAILESSNDAIVSKTLDGTISFWNDEAERLFGYAAAEAVGRPITIVIPADRQDEEREIMGRLRRGERVEHFETVRVARDGRRIDVSLTISPIRDHAGRIVGASKVARDITERKRTEAVLRDADRRKDEFLALLAHELRNPLAPLRNGLEILRLRPGEKAVAHAQAVMERQLQHMVRLVDDLLDASRISRNKMELRRSRVLLSDVLSSAIETVRPAVDAAGHELIVSQPVEPVHLDADLTRLSQVFSNLLANSVKFTETGGRIWITAARDGHDVVVRVRDSGIGLTADSLPHLFTMFSQVEHAIDRSAGGLGIGLALVKALVEMHGGTVAAESPGSHQGSTFTVRLPALEATEDPAASDPAASPAAASVKRRVLVVDDNTDSAGSMAVMLQLAGHDVHSVHDGMDALAAADRFRPDVVLMDVGMPRLDGYSATRQLRQKAWARDLLIVTVTGWGQDRDKRLSRDAGSDAHFVKPVKLSDLEALFAKRTVDGRVRRSTGTDESGASPG